MLGEGACTFQSSGSLDPVREAAAAFGVAFGTGHARAALGSGSSASSSTPYEDTDKKAPVSFRPPEPAVGQDSEPRSARNFMTKDWGSTGSVCEDALRKARAQQPAGQGEPQELPQGYGAVPSLHHRYLPENHGETSATRPADGPGALRPVPKNTGTIWDTEFNHSSSLTIGDVQKQMPNPDKLKDLVKYKGPASKKTVLKQATTNAELQKAVENGDPDMVAAILRYGLAKRCVNVNAPLWPKRERMLHLAARGDYRDICIMLLEAKAELDIEEITDGRHPLHDACKHGSYDVTELLLDKKAHIEECTFTGMRPIHWAAANGHADVVDLLLDRRAKIDAVSSDTKEPIHHAAIGGHGEVIRLLHRRKANVDVETSNRERPIHLACQGGHLRAVAVLMDFGALGVMDGDGPKGAMTKFSDTTFGEFVRRVEQLRFLRDDAEEFYDMGQQDEADEAFRSVVQGFSELGLVNAARAAHADAERCGVSLPAVEV